MRHAKAEPFASTDHLRRLTDRGTAAARDTGSRLRELGLLPDVAVVSSAVRTRETWGALAETAGIDCEPRYDDALVTGSPDVALEALRTVPEDADTVMFLGHNPTAAYLCHLLDDGDGDPSAVSGMLQGFPPGAVAVLEVGVKWADLGPETGRVVEFFVA